MIEFLQFMYQCALAYRGNQTAPPGRRKVSYFAVSRHDRDAWVISALALENGFTAGTWRER